MLVNYLLSRLGAGRAPQIVYEKCLNRHTRPSPCRLCEDACPFGAVTCLGRPAIDERKCDGCGLCVAACPARCLVQGAYHAFACHEILSATFPTIGCDGTGSTLKVGCLAGQPWEFYAALILFRGEGRPFALDISRCFSCDKRKATWQLFRALRRVDRFLGQNCRKKATHLLCSDPGDKLAMSRREMFALLGKRSESLARQIAVDLIQHRQKLQGNPYRLLLKEAVQRTGSAVLLPLRAVTTACDGCGLCRSACPQGAWELSYRSENLAELVFYPWDCTECSTCAEICPHAAIEQQAFPWQSVTQDAVVTKIFTLVPCLKCKKPLVDKQGSLCPACRKRESLKKELASRI